MPSSSTFIMSSCRQLVVRWTESPGLYGHWALMGQRNLLVQERGLLDRYNSFQSRHAPLTTWEDIAVLRHPVIHLGQLRSSATHPVFEDNLLFAFVPVDVEAFGGLADVRPSRS